MTSLTDADSADQPSAGGSFTDFDLPEKMLSTLAREGLVVPTPIQQMSIPLLLLGHDLIGLAQTGTGKTAAFLLPLMTQLSYSPSVRSGQPPKALILAPTRELANQISANLSRLSADMNIRHICVFGGARYEGQIRGLKRGVDIVVATPGRLMDLMERGSFDPSGITHWILDEADHMLDLGFYPAMKHISASLPADRQTMLFSATMPPEIEKLGNEFLTDPERVKAPQTGITADKITQHVTLMAEGDKRDRLCDVLNHEDTGQCLIFVRTKRRADALSKFMEARGFAVDTLHGDMRQGLRQKVLRNFRDGKLQGLIATDVAARGIDIAGLSHVVNFDITDTPEAYVHRIGRTGRAGLGGLALSFCSPSEEPRLAAIISVVGSRVELFDMDGEAVTDFHAKPAKAKGRSRQRSGNRNASGRSRGDRPENGRPANRRSDNDRSSNRFADNDRKSSRTDDGSSSTKKWNKKPDENKTRATNKWSSHDNSGNDERRSTRGASKPSSNSKPARSGKSISKPDFGKKPFGKKPWEKSGDRPARSNDNHTQRDDRPQRDNKRSDKHVDDDKPRFGKKPSFGKKPPFGKKPSFAAQSNTEGKRRNADGERRDSNRDDTKKDNRSGKPSFGKAGKPKSKPNSRSASKPGSRSAAPRSAGGEKRLRRKNNA
ncbi:DEAD/DEAH box helicase [Candidatus Puniceispirillum sp.]|uniref:DEAD/DEAH box helicase n=1 Tax=Candidatus Puniceispirillum sp. TaxID=2026719 RepID=UPI001ED35558|nr:DEAD/DEAH box helicase [Candidatus Puniceispirillum sp.]